MAKTIREIAEEIGVSKSAIHQKRKKEPLNSALQCFTVSVDGALHIEDEGVKLIKQAFSTVSERGSVKDREALTDNFTESTVNDREAVYGKFTLKNEKNEKNEESLQVLLHTLQGELEVKNNQIEAQQKTISELTAALLKTTETLQAAQALHAGTIQSQLEAQSQNTPSEQPESPAEGSSDESGVEARVEEKTPPKGFWGRLFQK